MADQDTEAQFVSTFWGMAESKSQIVDAVMTHVEPTMFEDPSFGKAYNRLRGAYATGASLNDYTLQRQVVDDVGPEWGTQIFTDRGNNTDLRAYAGKVLVNWRAREQHKMLTQAANQTLKLISEGKESKVHKLTDGLFGEVIRLHNTGSSSSSKTPQTKDEYTAAELAKIDKVTTDRGISLPYNKLQEEVGNLIPGDCVGVAAYSNGGKSTFLANLWRWFAIQGHPTIVFPTEMRERWLSRSFAAHARIPQSIAEREQWQLATEEQKVAYRLAVQDLGRCPWEVVNKANITVDEIISRATVIRRRWPGKPVIVAVDHMHRLDYKGMDADFVAGEATKRLRDWAAEDQEGGIILVLLYQPRKPMDEIELYKPVRGDQIRGKSNIWNELDIMLSPYRRWVKVVPGWEKNPHLRTPWGTPSCMYDSKNTHLPAFTKPNDPEGKLDDEHAYIKIGKRRVGGEGIGTLMFQMEAPTGFIHEIAIKPRGLIAL